MRTKLVIGTAESGQASDPGLGSGPDATPKIRARFGSETKAPHELSDPKPLFRTKLGSDATRLRRKSRTERVECKKSFGRRSRVPDHARDLKGNRNLAMLWSATF